MSLFSPVSASNYLASFRPVGPVEGYENVASQIFTGALGAIPEKNQTAELAMAGATLQQLGRLKEQQDLLDYNKWALGQQQKQNRRDALRMAGAGLMQAFAGGGIQLPGLTDPRQAQIDQQTAQAAMRQYRNARMTGSSATTAAVLKGLG